MAERVLYIPSIGYCMLIGQLAEYGFKINRKVCISFILNVHLINDINL